MCIRLAARPRATGVTIALVLFFAPRDGLRTQTVSPPESFDVEYYDVDALLEAAHSGEPFALSFLGADHLVEVEQTLLRSDRFRARAISSDGERAIHPAAPKTFKGSVVNDPGSRVRLSFTRRGVTGTIKTTDGWVFIEPSPREPVATGVVTTASDEEHRVFTEDDLDPDFSGTCVVRAVPGRVETASRPVATGVVASAEVPGVIEMAIDADSDYFDIHGVDATAEIESTLNSVNGIFETDLGLRIEIVSINIWEDKGEDPYTESEPLDLLLQFQDYWNINHDAIQRDLTHLFTGKNLDGSTVGIAYLDAVCSSTSAYGLSQDLGSSALMPILVSHEIGHNLGAGHDPVGSDPRYVMFPAISKKVLSEFSADSQDEIAAFVDGVTCVTPADSGSDGGSPGEDSGGGGGGGGGGGPVDPLLLCLVASGVLAERLARRRRRQP